MTREAKSAVTQVSGEDASGPKRPGKPATMTAVLLPGAMEPLYFRGPRENKMSSPLCEPPVRSEAL